MDMISQMAADVAALPSKEVLTDIGHLAAKQLAIQARIEQLEADLKMANAELKQVQEYDLPDALLATGLREVKLLDGRKLVINKYYSGSIAEERADAAFSWLKEHGYEDIIKNNVILAFGKGEDEKAKQLCFALVESGYDPVNKKSVHPSTLKAFIKEQVESGADFPLEVFGAYIGNKAVIK